MALSFKVEGLFGQGRLGDEGTDPSIQDTTNLETAQNP